MLEKTTSIKVFLNYDKNNDSDGYCKEGLLSPILN